MSGGASTSRSRPFTTSFIGEPPRGGPERPPGTRHMPARNYEDSRDGPLRDGGPERSERLVDFRLGVEDAGGEAGVAVRVGAGAGDDLLVEEQLHHFLGLLAVDLEAADAGRQRGGAGGVEAHA